MRRVTEHTVWDVVRRGKTLGFSLDSGDRIDVHLMLKGNMYFAEPKIPEPCVALDFEDGASLVFSDSQYSVSPALHEHRGSRSVLIRKAGSIRSRIHGRDFDRNLPKKEGAHQSAAHGSEGDRRPGKRLLCGRHSLGSQDKTRPNRRSDDCRGSEKDHQAIGEILDLALRQTRKGLAGQVHGEVRDYFRVHLKTGKPCPQRGTKIAQEYFRQSDHQLVPDLSDLVPPYIATLDELSGRSNSHANFVKVL